MNKIFEQFSLQAGGSHYPKINSELQQQFGEMIVKECVRIVENLSPGYDDYRDQIEDAFRRDCVYEIKKHFGISNDRSD